jgi:integrase
VTPHGRLEQHGKRTKNTVEPFAYSRGEATRRRPRNAQAPRCEVCRQPESEHKTEGHLFKRDSSLPEWHGWHAFRPGLATNLHTLRADDKTIQAILRHSNIGITQNIYIKSVNELQVNAMDTLCENLDLCNVSATSGEKRPN